MTYLYEELLAPTRLYIKQCPHCGLKYFGKTIAEDIENYQGSGIYWTRHLKKHNVKSLHVWNSNLYYDTSIVIFATNFSNTNKIVESKEWANLAIENGIDGGYLGKEVSIKISQTKQSKEWKESIGKEVSIKISKCRKGTTLSDETKKKLSDANKGERNGFYGKTHTEEQKQIWAETRKNFTHNVEAKKKISDANKGERNSFYGKTHDQETLKMIALASSEKVTCPHCNKIGGKSGMHRWHFNKCRYRKIDL